MDNSQMGMFDPLGNSMNTPSSVHAHQQQSHSQGTPHHPHQHNQQNYPQQNQHFNSNMSNNQHIEQKHNPVGSWQRGGWDSGIQSGKKKLRVALLACFYQKTIKLFQNFRCNLSNSINYLRSFRSICHCFWIFWTYSRFPKYNCSPSWWSSSWPTATLWCTISCTTSSCWDATNVWLSRRRGSCHWYPKTYRIFEIEWYCRCTTSESGHSSVFKKRTSQSRVNHPPRCHTVTYCSSWQY